MNSTRRWILLAIVVLVVAIPLVVWLAAPLFVDRQVDEAFPFDLPPAEAAAAMPEEEKAAAVQAVVDAMDAEGADAMPAATMEAVKEQTMALAATLEDKEMGEDMPAGEGDWAVVAEGRFRDADDFHRGSGGATIFQQGERRVLRLEDFAVTNGPDLHVLLVENPDAGASGEMGDYVDLGSLKGNVGNQNYEIPEDVDLEQYRGVMIYCMPFHVVFSTAPFGGS